MIGPTGHVAERRLGDAAEGIDLGPAERRHVDACPDCRHLLERHHLVLDVLSGPWAAHVTGAAAVRGAFRVPPRPVQARSPVHRPGRLMLPMVAVLGLVVLGGGLLISAGERRASQPPLPSSLQQPSPRATTAGLVPATVRPGAPSVAGGSIVRVEARSGDVREVIPLPGGPGLLGAAGGYLWVFNYADGSVTRVDPTTSEVIGSVPFETGAAAMAGDGEDLWIAAEANQLVLLDGRWGVETSRFELSTEPLFRAGDAGFLAIAGGSVWITVPAADPASVSHELWRVDALTGQVQQRLMIDRDPHPPAAGESALYIVSRSANSMTRVDLESNELTEVRIGGGPYAVTVGAGSVWVGFDRAQEIRRIDPVSLEAEATIELAEPVRGLAFDAGRLWATTWTSLHEIDPETNQVLATTRLLKLPTRRGPAGLVVIGDSVWIGVEE